MAEEQGKLDAAQLGALSIAAASVLWAFGYLVRKTALHSIAGVSLTLYISITVSLFFVLVFRPKVEEVRVAFLRHAKLYFGLAFFGVVVGTTAMFLGICRLPLGVALLLEKLQPLFTLAAAHLFLGEKLERRAAPYIATALVSSYFVTSKYPLNVSLGGTDPWGVAYVVLAAFSWGISSVIGRRLMLDGPDPRVVTLLRFTIGSLMLLPIVLVMGAYEPSDFSTKTLAAMIFVAVASTGSGYLLFYFGLKQVSASVSGFLELLTPVVGLLLGTILLDESLTATQLLAAPVLLTAVYRLAQLPRAPDPEPAKR